MKGRQSGMNFRTAHVNITNLDGKPMSDYEQEEYEKVMTVVRAALQNRGYGDKIEIKTSGHEPAASVSVKANVFEKFLKAPRS